MKAKFEKLIKEALQLQVTDIHFSFSKKQVKISLRTLHGFKLLPPDEEALGLLNYLKYCANLDLGNMGKPQSGQFESVIDGRCLYFRFSYLMTLQVESAVLRILGQQQNLTLEQLSDDRRVQRVFATWTHLRNGLILLSGPTGSGKTTTLNAILSKIAENQQLKVISLEDPIEIVNDSYLQLQINEKINFTYEEGIKQLLRHDPDVIMIGEVRDENTAKMAYRCALSGHLVFTTIHTKCASEAIKRLLEFGLTANELSGTLSAVMNQRLFASKKGKGRICIYEILDREMLQRAIYGEQIQHEDIFQLIKKAAEYGNIYKKDAQQEVELE